MTVVTVKLHRVGYRHPCHYEQLLTAAVPHKLCKLVAFKNICDLSYYTDSNVHNANEWYMKKRAANAALIYQI